MYFKNSEGERVALAAGSSVCWNSTDKMVRYFGPNGMLIDYVKDGANEPTFDGVVDDFGSFRIRALAAARWFNMNIKPVPKATAFEFINEQI